MRISARGVGLLVAAVALLGTGFRLGYPELAVIGTAGAVALICAVGYVAWRPGLSVDRVADPDRVMRGEASRVTLTVGNTSRLRAATLVAYDRCGRGVVGVPLLRLRAGARTTVAYPVPTDRRGVVTIGPLRVVRRDPLALLTLARSHGGVERVLVYPTVHPLAAVPTGIVRSLDGLVDRVPHGTITFDTLREYVIGDELRHVHWRTTARIGELMVREHLDTSLPRLVILLDDRASAYPPATPPAEPARPADPAKPADPARPGDPAKPAATAATAEPGATGATGATAAPINDAFEAACEAAASIVMVAARDELPVALQLTSGAVVDAGGRRRHGTRPYLDALAEAELTTAARPRGDARGSSGSPDALETATARLRHHRLGDTLIFLTGPGRAADLGLVGSLRGGYPTIIVGLLGGAGAAPPTMEGILVLAAKDGAEFAAAWDGVPAW